MLIEQFFFCSKKESDLNFIVFKPKRSYNLGFTAWPNDSMIIENSKILD